MRAERALIHHHRDLPVTQCRTGSATVSLIGYAIDPHDPHAKDTAIVARLAERTTDRETVLHAAAQLGGRWVLLVESDDYSILLHDACGLRQVFYSDRTHSDAFCASQASTAAKVYRLEDDPEAIDGFLRTKSYQSHREPWWPGDSTRFRGVRCLLPNHYLDLRTREAHRYGLSEKLCQNAVGDASCAGAGLLTNLVQGAAERYQLALPITAGWDSRVLLAVCHHIGAGPYCYTLKMAGYGDDHQDIRIPKQLLASIRLKHHVIDCTTAASAEFIAFYKNLTDPAHDEACVIADGLQRGYPDGFVSLSGHCSEVARCFYQLKPEAGPTTPEALAKIAQMDASPFVLAQFRRWLEGARSVTAQTGIPLSDLFYWEQRAGRWAANGQAQWDLVHERFSAFNCRPLLLAFLATDAKYRQPDYLLYRRLIQQLAPDMLREPINPDTAPKTWKRSIPRAVARRARAALGI